MRQNQTIGDRYVIGERLGAGAMGSVFLADDTRFLKTVVIKALHPNLALNDRIRERFKTEALIQGNLAHPNIVRATDFFEDVDQDLLAIVMDFVDGPDLELHLVEEMGGRLTLPRICSIMLPVMDGVHFAHSKGVVHRDLKPANIMLERGDGLEVPKITDFGIAKLLSEDNHSQTRAGAVIGTPSFMPPEQLRGAKDIDHRVDVYALGAILYQLATGRLPFGDDTEYEITHKVLSGVRPDPPSTVAPALGPRFDALIDRAMHPDRSLRYQDVGDLRRDLAALTDEGHSDTPSVHNAAPMKSPAALEPRSLTHTTEATSSTTQRVLSSHTKAPTEARTINLTATALLIPGLALLLFAAFFLGQTSSDNERDPAMDAPRIQTPGGTPPGAATEPAPQREPPAATAPTPPPPDPGPTPLEEAERAFRAHVEAFNRRDEDTYIGGFQNPMDCLYGTDEYPTSNIRRFYRKRHVNSGMRLTVSRIEQVQAPSPTEAHLRVFGQDIDPKGPPRDYHKYIILKKRGGRWKIAMEDGYKSRNKCRPELFD